MRLPQWFCCGLFLAGLGCLAWFVGPVQAQRGAGGRKSAPQPLVVVLQELKQARVLLDEANHDYDGHRVKALQDVRKATHTLKQALPAKGPSKKPTHQGKQGQQHAKGSNQAQKKPKGNTEAQAVSDAQMRQAAQILRTVLGQLGTFPANAQTAQAAPLLHQAVREIELGLAFRQQQSAAGVGVR